MEPHSSRRSLVLVASEGEWAGRSFESVLDAHGYAVQRATSGQSAIESARVEAPDAVIVDGSLSDMDAPHLLQQLRFELVFGAATPMIVTSSSSASTSERERVYSAGAWDYCIQPLDVDVLLLKLRTFVGARLSAGQVKQQLLVDPKTGLYNDRGIQRWTHDLAARAIRKHEAFATIALRATNGWGDHAVDPASDTIIRRTASFMSEHRRASDILGHIGGGVFVVLAPDTDGSGASHLIDRLQRAALSTFTRELPEGEVPLTVGYWATADLADSLVTDDLVGRATSALSHIRQTRRFSGVVSFDEISAT